MPLIEELSYATAEEFIEALWPHHHLWVGTGGVVHWIFRGQGGDWPLHPKAMRRSPFPFIHYGIAASGPMPVPTMVGEQVKLEGQFVSEFASACIRAGRVLPEDGQPIRSSALQRQLFGDKVLDELALGIEVPLPITRSLVALAQHHGVPTRLLDWSFDAGVATYFACEGVARELTKPVADRKLYSDTLVVWALRDIAFTYVGEQAHRMDPVIETIEAPYAENPRLAAQRGTFTLVVHKHAQPAGTPILKTIPEVLELYEITKFKGVGRSPEGPFARKLSLPHAEAPRLLRLLGQAGINASTIYPDYDGVLKAIEETQYWA